MKKVAIIIVTTLIVGGAGYWGWNEYSISQLESKLAAAESQQVPTVDGQTFLKSFSQIALVYAEAKGTQPPIFADEYAAISSKCCNVIAAAPSRASNWVKSHRASAWSAIGMELQPKSNVTDQELVTAVRELKGVCDIGLRTQDEVAKAVKAMSIEPRFVTGLSDLAHEVKSTTRQVSELALVGQKIAEVKGRARQQVQQGLREIDAANRKIEKYAEVSTLRQACYDWEAAYSTIASSRSTLSNLPSFSRFHQSALAAALVKSDRESVNDILSKITPHVSKARAELSKAEHQESTVAGRAGRTLGRLFEQTKEKVSQSRIGKEVAVSFKAMVLGTKIFYDMMDMNSSSDLIGLATRYEGDMNQLLTEADEINRMDGWSLTGKNTFIETWTDEAYRKSFRPDPNHSDERLSGTESQEASHSAGTVTDYDGNRYRTIKIGDQWWMAENLKVTHYRNGDPIPHVIDGTKWWRLTSGAYCNFNNDVSNVATYGRLYNWYAVNDIRNIAPEGWHVPTDEEWKQLEIYLGMNQAMAEGTNYRGTNEGNKLKGTDTTYWNSSPNIVATNESGFNALPGGWRLPNPYGWFDEKGDFAHFWCSPESSNHDAWTRDLGYNISQVARGINNKNLGMSVRCVRD